LMRWGRGSGIWGGRGRGIGCLGEVAARVQSYQGQNA
jgi:hypothetical protein